MQNSINPLFSIAESRAALVERSREAARQVELDDDGELEAILARYRGLPEVE